jgi:hypothetical protein
MEKKYTKNYFSEIKNIPKKAQNIGSNNGASLKKIVQQLPEI